GIGLRTDTTPVVFRNGALLVVPGRAIRTDRVVSLPLPEGRLIPGMPDAGRGFVRTDQHGRVDGREDVYAAGDITTFPLKKGGIAAQQAHLGLHAPFRPGLRGVLLTGFDPRFLSASLVDDSSELDTEALWWP